MLPVFCPFYVKPHHLRIYLFISPSLLLYKSAVGFYDKSHIHIRIYLFIYLLFLSFPPENKKSKSPVHFLGKIHIYRNISTYLFIYLFTYLLIILIFFP